MGTQAVLISPNLGLKTSEKKAVDPNIISVDKKHNVEIETSKHLTIGRHYTWIPGLNFTDFHSKIHKKLPFNPDRSSSPRVKFSNRKFFQITGANYHISNYFSITEKNDCDANCALKPDILLIEDNISHLFEDIEENRSVLPSVMREFVPLRPNVTCQKKLIKVGSTANEPKMRVITLLLDGILHPGKPDIKSEKKRLNLPIQVPRSCLDTLINFN